jgi:hypothetical protein
MNVISGQTISTSCENLTSPFYSAYFKLWLYKKKKKKKKKTNNVVLPQRKKPHAAPPRGGGFFGQVWG